VPGVPWVSVGGGQEREQCKRRDDERCRFHDRTLCLLEGLKW
jgi:hypothetical protein